MSSDDILLLLAESNLFKKSQPKYLAIGICAQKQNGERTYLSDQYSSALCLK